MSMKYTFGSKEKEKVFLRYEQTKTHFFNAHLYCYYKELKKKHFKKNFKEVIINLTYHKDNKDCLMLQAPVA